MSEFNYQNSEAALRIFRSSRSSKGTRSFMSAAAIAVVVEGVVIIGLFILVGYMVNKLAGAAPNRIVRALVALTVLLGAVPAVLWAMSTLPQV